MYIVADENATIDCCALPRSRQDFNVHYYRRRRFVAAASAATAGC